MVGNHPGHNLRGRSDECATLDRLIASARSGESGVLVVRGEAGVGKSALLDYAAENATGFRVTRTAGVEADVDLAYAGLHQLCVPKLDRLDRLPAPQRDALAIAFGQCAGPPPTASWSASPC